MELGESIGDTEVCEVKEKPGSTSKSPGLIGVHTNPRCVMACTDGELRIGTESTDIASTHPQRIQWLNMRLSMLRISTILSTAPRPMPMVAASRAAQPSLVSQTGGPSTAEQLLACGVRSFFTYIKDLATRCRTPHSPRRLPVPIPIR